MELGFGHRYKASFNNLTVPLSPSAFDLIMIAPASNVPVLVDRIVCTAGVSAGGLIQVVLTRRSTASTGGTAITPTPSSPSSPAASCAVTYLNVSTVGTVSGTPLDSQWWNEFAPYEYNVRPGADLIVPGTWASLYIPAAPTATFPASFTVELIEIK